MYQIPVESGIFGISIVTIVEVILGILKPDSLHFSHFLGWICLMDIYGLTVYKAYYIVYAFMHMEVKSALRYAVVLPVYFNFIFTFLFFWLKVYLWGFKRFDH
jgi:cytochrome c oxidase subunit IV